MDGKIEQRVCIKFCVKRDDKRSERPFTSKSTENVEKI
jgi:hypothetical protein